MERYSRVKIRETQEFKTVKITSQLKPGIINSIVRKWQSLLDSTAKFLQIPSALIMCLNEDSIQVFLKSQTDGNIYEVGEESKLHYGLYCETVIGTQERLIVPNATINPVWRDNNPDVDLNMISYIGFPINWPDGEVFGTVCALDSKEKYYSDDFRNLLQQIKVQIETDLDLLVLNKELNEKKLQLKEQNNLKAKFLSLISHDVRGGIGTINDFLKLLICDLDELEKPYLKKILNSLSRNAESLYQTLESLLEWSKNDLLKLEPENNSVNIVEIIEQLLIYFNQTLIIKDLKINKEYCADKVVISTDKNMFTTILRNILSNAIKYTNKGGEITIRIGRLNERQSVEIEDTGIGMDKCSLDFLFRYDKSHNEQGTSGESSAGIGLMLVRDFLAKINALAEVTSKPGKGTKFKIIL